MSAEKVLAQVAHLEQLLEAATARPWWNSHGEPAAGDKSLWDEWEALDGDSSLPEPWDDGRRWDPLFWGDVENEHDTALIVAAVNALPALLELKRAAVECMALKHRPGKSWAERMEVVRLELRLAEIALVVLEGV